MMTLQTYHRETVWLVGLFFIGQVIDPLIGSGWGIASSYGADFLVGSKTYI